jgi:hypothetical protein
MSNSKKVLAGLAAVVLLGAADVSSPQALPNPYRAVDGWAKLPNGREMGAVGDVAIDPDGRHVWAVIRCDAGPEVFGWECLDSDLDAVVKFGPDGSVVESFGGGMFIWPHGIDVDSDGNVWVQEFVLPWDDTAAWSVFDDRCGYVGDMHLPTAFTPMEITSDRMLGVWRDELDVETVRAYELTRN